MLVKGATDEELIITQFVDQDIFFNSTHEIKIEYEYILSEIWITSPATSSNYYKFGNVKPET